MPKKDKEIAQELNEEFNKGNFKPSQLKRSKSESDLTNTPAAPPLPACPYCPPLKKQLSQLQDQILELRISKLKEFGEYYQKKQQLEQDLESNVNYGLKEIEKLENKLRTINKKKLELQVQLGQSQSEKARLEIKLINAENKEASSPNSNWWTDYRFLLISLLTYWLIIWLLSKNNQKQ